MTLVDETHMYEGVGRMFILQSKEVIHNQLLEKQKIAEEKIKELEVFARRTGLSGLLKATQLAEKILSRAQCEGCRGQHSGNADGQKGTVKSTMRNFFLPPSSTPIEWDRPVDTDVF
ncbi:prefoldin subunit 1 isoform X3 [Macrotis lagotis]